MSSIQPPKYRIPHESLLARQLTTVAWQMDQDAQFRNQDKKCPCSFVRIGTPQSDVTIVMLRRHPWNLANYEDFNNRLAVAIDVLLYPYRDINDLLYPYRDIND